MVNRNNENKKNKLVVTKTIQTVKSTVKNRNSEESENKIINLASALKNRNRKANMKLTQESIETENDELGDSRSMWRSTWAECLSLYQLAKQGQIIKSDDKDSYLPSKLFGYHIFNSNASLYKFYKFYIQRMIVCTFLRVSKKQALNSSAIEKLVLCVDSLKNIIKKHLGYEDIESLYNQFILCVSNCYSELEGLDGPDLLKNLSDAMISIMMKVEKGWFGNTYKTKKNYNKNDLIVLIRKDIEQLRMDAINALYNSVLRNKKILTKEILKKIENGINNSDDENGDDFDRNDTERFKNVLFKILDLVESNPDLDYSALFQIYFKLLESQTCSFQSLKSAVNFLSNQSRDHQRCELFTDSRIENLLRFLSRNNLENDIKVYLIEIINNYLEHDFSKGLTEKQLKNLIEYIICNNNSTGEMVDAAFLSILLTVEKTQTIPKSIREYFLIENKIILENYGNFIIFILSRVKDHMPLKQEIETLSQHLENEFLVVDENDSMIKFEKLSNSNSQYTSVSLIVSKLILASIENKVHVSGQTIDNLLLAIEKSNDKQTKIISAKCIFKLSDYCDFDNANLNSIKNNVSHEVYDISVYLHTAYLKDLAKLSKQSKSPIESYYLESLSALHIKESLKIGDYDFSNDINTSLLEILKQEAKKQKFEDENLFVLLNDILYTNENHAYEALDILESYTAKKFKIPESTIAALENTLMSKKDLYDKALFILQCVIQNGQSVNSTTLQIFIDNLYNSSNSRRRFKAFKCLEQARLNQDIQDEIFFKLELQKAGFGLSRVTDTKPLLDFVKTQTDKGFLMPIDTMIALEKELDDENVLDIILNLTKLKQILDYNLLNELTRKFNPNSSSNNQNLISIFANVSTNNQKLSPELLNKLELALNNKSMEANVLSIFVHRAQKGETLTVHIIEKILNRIKNESNLMIRQEYLSSLASLIQNNLNLIKDSIKSDIESILFKNMDAGNANTQNICVNGWRSLINNFRIDNKYLTQLIQIGTNSKCDESVKENLKQLLSSMMSSKQNCLTQDLKASIQLDNLKYKSNDELLDKISVYIKNENSLLTQNYKQLVSVIDEGSSNLQQRTLELLNSYKYKDEISSDLIESIVFLHESTNSKETKYLCLNLLNNIKLKSDRSTQVSNKISMILHEKSENDKANYYQSEFEKSKIYSLFKHQFKLDDSKIQNLLKLLKIDKNLLDMKDIEQFLFICLKTIPDYYENFAFIFLIEQILLSGQQSIEALVCYNRIIEEKKYQNLEGVLEKLFEIKMLNSDILALVIKCICNSVELIIVPTNCLKLLENSIEHKNELIRSCSFKGLKMAVNKYKNYNFDIFNNWCDNKLKELSKLTNMNFTPTKKYLDYLEILTSLNSIDLEVFKSQPQKVWKRELLISSLFKYFQPSDSEKMMFYTSCLEITDKFKYIDSIKILVHLHDRISTFESINEINETLVIMKDFDLNTILNTLRRDLVPFQSLRFKWCIENILKILKNKEEINRNYIENLADKMLLLLDLRLIEQIFHSILSIDNLKAFESLIDFCFVENVKVNDISFENVESVRDLQSLIEVKHICNYLQSTENNNNWDLFNLLFNLMKKNWSYEQLMQLTQTLKNTNLRRPIQDTIDALKIIEYFKLTSMKYEEYLAVILNSKHTTELLKNLNRLAVENSFQEKGKIKDGTELLVELEVLNSNDEQLLEYIKTNLPNQLKNIKSESLKSAILSNNVNIPICEWSEKHIGLWADKIASLNVDEIDPFLEEAVAVIKRANFIFTRFELTDTQILCSLISLNSSKNSRGKLLQVATGEGKSTIVCILAIINALTSKDDKVNIITSSSVLAERDAKDKNKLFKMFNLKCSSNNDASVYIKGKHILSVISAKLSIFVNRLINLRSKRLLYLKYSLR